MKNQTLIREATFGNVVSEEDRTIEISVSSEYPVKRYDGEEILDHNEGSIDFSRFPLPLIKVHDRWSLNIGIFENPEIKDKKLRGVMRFGERDEAQEIWKDVKNGIIRGVSIGYTAIDLSDVDKGQYHVTRWMPFEVSLCPVAADPTVGVGRSLDTFNIEDIDKAISEIPEEKREEFVSRIIEITEKYKTPAESDETAVKDEPTLRNMKIEDVEREIKLKSREVETNES